MVRQHGQPRKWSAREIAAEAMREPDACPHEQPQPPQVLHGCTPAEAAKLAHDWADSSQDAKGRKLRADGLALAAGVVSCPLSSARTGPAFVKPPWRGCGSNSGWRAPWWRAHRRGPPSSAFLRSTPAGEGSRCFTQEGRPQKRKSQGAKKGAQNAAYKQAMVGWQDGFQRAVAAHFGLTRRGPESGD